MKTPEDLLACVRESRIRLSAEAGNDPAAYVSMLRRFDKKYARQIKEFQGLKHRAEKIA